jgi:SpoVK/Ycf46/Vps4 family AAA+-type ATPase
MELQCKERVDLLEALKVSRLEKEKGSSEDLSAGASSASSRITKDKERDKEKEKAKEKEKSSRPLAEVDRVDKGWIGGGSIPAVSYPEISRPPPLPNRPSLKPRNSSERAVVGSRTPLSNPFAASSSRTPIPTLSGSSSLVPPMKKSSRSPSPEKARSMLTTLRTDKNGKKSSKSPRVSSAKKVEGPGASKAASLAWQSISRGGRDRLGRSIDAEAGGSSTTLDGLRKETNSVPPPSDKPVHFDFTTRRLVSGEVPRSSSPRDMPNGEKLYHATGKSNGYPFPPTDPGQPGAVSGSMLTPGAVEDIIKLDSSITGSSSPSSSSRKHTPPPVPSHKSLKLQPMKYPTYLNEYPETTAKKQDIQAALPVRRRSLERARVNDDATGSSAKVVRKPVANTSSPRHREKVSDKDEDRRAQRKEVRRSKEGDASPSVEDDTASSGGNIARPRRKAPKQKGKEEPILAEPATPTTDNSETEENIARSAWDERVAHLMKNLPKGVDEGAAKQIFNEIVVQGDEVHWDDVAGLEVAKNALKEAVVYPFLRPDLFMGLREPARGMLLFGPPGTGKTMLARAVATESKSTFFSISASSLTSKYLGESEKLVRALFSLAKALAPSIIFVDEIDSLLSSRSGSGEHEATRRIKTEFLIQWSDLQRAAAGREQSEKDKERGDASRVLVLAATNLPWAIDEAARRRFVRRQYIPLPEEETRAVQLTTLLGHQKHGLTAKDILKLVQLTDGAFTLLILIKFQTVTNNLIGFSGSDITALAKDAAMGPLRSLGEALLHMSMDQIRPIQFKDFEASLVNIRPSVSKQGLKEFEDWAKEFGERGG